MLLFSLINIGTVLPVRWAAATASLPVVHALDYCLKKPVVKYKTFGSEGERSTANSRSENAIYNFSAGVERLLSSFNLAVSLQDYSGRRELMGVTG